MKLIANCERSPIASIAAGRQLELGALDARCLQ
jgi:hypothetical protein